MFSYSVLISIDLGLTLTQLAENRGKDEQIATKDQLLATKDEQIATKNRELATKDVQINALQNDVVAKETRLQVQL